MKKLLLTITILSMAFAINAQTVNGVELSDIDADYVEIGIFAKGKQMIATLDYGQEYSNKAKDNEILDETGKTYLFNSAAHVLNFMSKLGYRYVNMYEVTGMGGKATYYTMEKRKTTK